jgi:hypothetical protein
MKSRSTIEKNRMVMNDLFEDIPNFGVLAFEHFLGTFNCVSMPEIFEAPYYKWLIQLESNLLREPALMQTEPWANDNHTSSGVIYSLAE